MSIGTRPPKRILIVEDDWQASLLLQRLLDQHHYAVIAAKSGEEALQIIERQGLPHLAIVDFHMPPGMDGPTFCRRVREFCDLPIIMLTAVDEVDTIIASLEQFADDYMVKPYKPAELVARVERVLRRVGDFAYTFTEKTRVDRRLTVNITGREAIVEGKSASLTPTESKILYLLMRNAGRTVTTDFLLRRIWPVERVPEERLHVHIYRLRRKLEKDPAHPDYILSARGEGYSFSAHREGTGIDFG